MFVSSGAAPADFGPPARFRVPTLRSAIDRPALIERLESLEASLVAVIAPAGYGKTTALSLVASRWAGPVAWVSLRPTDDDVGALGRSIAAALIQAGCASTELLAEIRAAVNETGSSVESVLAATLEESGPGLLLVLDEIGHVCSDRANALVGELVDHVPRGSKLVLSGRRPPGFLPRRIVEGSGVEIGAAALAFDYAEVREVLTRAGTAISDADAAALAGLTEGWPVAIQLIAHVATDQARGGDLPAWVAGAGASLGSYLWAEVVSRLDPIEQDLLLRTSGLDDLGPDLCDHVLETTGSGAVLERLERAQVFLTAMDADRQWFRLHRVVRDLLRADARRTIPEPDRQALDRRAADWFDAHGQHETAIEHRLRARDLNRLGPAIVRVARPTFLDGRMATVARWIDAAGVEAAKRYPPLAVLAGWQAALTGRPADAERWAAIASSLEFEGELPGGWSTYAGSVAALRALLCADGIDQMLADGRAALEGEPPWSPLRNTLTWLVGQALELAGAAEEAAARYEEVDRLDEDRGFRPILIAPVCAALLAMDRGDLDRAAAALDRVERVGAPFDPSEYLAGALGQAARARFAVLRGELDEARERARLGGEARERATYAIPYVAVRLRSTVAEVELALGNAPTASDLADEIDAILKHRPDLGTLAGASSDLRRRIADRSALVPVAPLTHAELRVLQLLPTHLTVPQIGEELFVSRHTIHSHMVSIYRKLGVSTRRAAVERARALRLLRTDEPASQRTDFT